MTQERKKKTAVLLLTGFLGAGKTTLLKRILSWETDLSDTVVLVNEFGDVGIDGALLKDAGSDVVELTSGCICCTLSADLKQSLLRIQQQFNPRRIFIESSGVADPTAIVPVLKETELAESMQLEKVVTVLDADYWEGREIFGPLFYNQLEAAHLILLNKIDQIDGAAVSRFLAEIHAVFPDCQVVPSVHCAVDPAALWTPVAPKGVTLRPMKLFREAVSETVEPHAEASGHAGNHAHRRPVAAGHFVTFSFEDAGIMDERCFKQFVAALPLEVFRMKGPVRFADRTEIINFVGGKGEWSHWEGPRETQLAFIGWRIVPDRILANLRHCLKAE